MAPQRLILKNSPGEFLEKYPINIVIIDATDPSALQEHSETYRTYKSHTTLKCLLGVDAKGGIMVISELNESSISDEQIVERSGFLDILKRKLIVEDIINTQRVARHRIHVERAICKIRRFRIFHSVIALLT